MTFPWTPGNLPDDPKELVRALREELFALKRGLEAVGTIQTPTLLNSWVNFGSGTTDAGYWKDQFGIVHLTGFIASGTITAAAFQLPEGYRPALAHRFPANSNGAYAQLRIDTTGDVVPATGSNVSFSLDGITFRAA